MSVPALVVGTVWAFAGEADRTAIPISVVATSDLNMATFLNCVRSSALATSEILSLFHFNTLLGPVGLEDHVNRFNDFLVLIGLTINDEFVLKGLGSVDLNHMLLAKAVVPTTIPGSQVICIFLKRVCQLSTG